MQFAVLPESGVRSCCPPDSSLCFGNHECRSDLCNGMGFTTVLSLADETVIDTEGKIKAGTTPEKQ